MKFENIDVTKTIEEAKNLLAAEKNLSPALRSVFTVVLMLLQVLLGKVSTNSKNSSKPPSQDPNRKKPSKTKENGKKAGGQEGHAGVCLEPVKNPDEVVKIKCEKKDLPKGKYKNVGYESRQVVNIHIRKKVTEYQAEILEDEQGNRFTAKFPGEVTQKIQYGESIKSHAVYLSQFQLLPYARIQDYFADQMKIPLSAGSIFNFNKEAYRRLEEFDTIAKQKLISSSLLHADETGINVNGTKLWLHNASNDQWVYFYPHKKRGNEAMNEIGILSKFNGVMVHDHWKAYYAYTDCLHSLCNSHHLRELLKVVEVNGHKWAQEMHDLLLEINLATKESDGILDPKIAQKYKERYRQILARGDIESPEPPPREKGKRPPKKEKHRNLLERLRNFESDALRFMENTIVPFTNNMGENDIRMTKVQQKISGCFRSIEGAKIFCRVRSYLLTCQKNALSPIEAIALLFSGKLPDFCY